MTNGQLNKAMRHIRSMLGAPGGADLTRVLQISEAASR